MLPQRRKSADEIAKLRETLGIPGEEDPQPTGDAAPSGDAPASPAEPRERRPVKSLRRSERQEEKPAVLSPVAKEKGIPTRRHDDRELMEIRRIQATPPDQSINHLRTLTAPWPQILLAYLLPAIGAGVGLFAAKAPGVPEPRFPWFWLADLSRAPWLGNAGFAIVVGTSVAALVTAGLVARQKPRFRHHAGFVTIFAVIVAVFGIIHHFDPTHGP